MAVEKGLWRGRLKHSYYDSSDAPLQKVRRALVCPVLPQNRELSAPRVFPDVNIYILIALVTCGFCLSFF